MNGKSFPSWNYISICAKFKFELAVDEDDCSLPPPQLYTKYVPSAEILFTGSLPSGHPAAKPCIEKKDRIKSRNSFFIL